MDRRRHSPVPAGRLLLSAVVAAACCPLLRPQTILDAADAGAVLSASSGAAQSRDFDEVWALRFENHDRTVSFDARDGNDFWRILMTPE